MFILTVILAVLLGAGFIMAGGGKVTGQTMMNETREHLMLEPSLWKGIGTLEILGAVGVLLGLTSDLAVIGVLAGVGLIAMTIGAVFYHQKAGDAMKDWMPAIVMGSIAIFYIIMRIATA